MQLKRLDIHLERPDFGPENIPIGELFGFLIEYERLLRRLAGKPEDAAETSDREMHLRLVGISNGSARITCLSPEPLYSGNRIISEVMHGRRDPPSEIIGGLLVLDETIRKRQWKVVFSGEDVESFSLGGESPFAMTPLKGETVVYGECIQVGGKTAKVKLSGNKGQIITVSVTKKLAKQIAPRLYEEIGLRGLATWEMNTRAMLSFKAYELLPYRRVSPSEAIDALSRVAGEDWARISDPDEFLEGLWRSTKRDGLNS